MVLGRIATTPLFSFQEETATLNFWTPTDIWVQERFGKTFVNSEEKPDQGKGEQPEPPW